MTNSRGTRITVRTSGETLANNDSVAMTPTIQPATAGTHVNRDRWPVLDGCGAIVEVIGREDMPSAIEFRVSGYQTGPVYFSPGPLPGSSGAALASRNAN
ncbi:uncharacterized protein RMCC_5064 [Mycolicibacterium canariasense]|uniref:Uncharacterized protein n=1 Tax=Mycolicibacterium canariasense TaxID=228230 RepID=A0A100WGK0_MYCCR|nr:uncharacterized protein RMCC_5064 [Mycolicibacterium canariasense]